MNGDVRRAIVESSNTRRARARAAVFVVFESCVGSPWWFAPRYGGRERLEYQFLTTWCIDAPIDRVFDAIDDAAQWPLWWRGVRRADLLEDGDETGVGRLGAFKWRSRLPYDLAFESRVTCIERPYLLEGHAHGELTGVGRWRLYAGRGTAAVYEWNVATSRAWMNRLAPIARPAFAWNHDVVMRKARTGSRNG